MPGAQQTLIMSVAKRKSVEECEAKGDDDDCLLTLSLGTIYNGGDAATAGARRAAALLSGDFKLPLTTPTHLPAAAAAPMRPVMNVAGAPSAAADSLLPPRSASALDDPAYARDFFATASVVHGGNGDSCAGAFFAAGGLTTASKLPLPTLPLLPLDFPSNSGTAGAFAVVPGYGSGARAPMMKDFVPVFVPPTKSAPASPKKKRRARSKKASVAASRNAAQAPAYINGGGGGLIPEIDHPPPFPWAKRDRVAEHYSLAELAERGIHFIEGEVQCKRCDVRRTISLDVKAKFKELRDFIARNILTMDDRAPDEWQEPVLPNCDKCGQKNSMRPVIPAEKEKINWVFLLLQQTLGLCTLDQLKHFCAHNNHHRTGAKDRVLYSTYMELCNQLYPGGLFDMAFERRNRNRPFA